MSSLGLIQSYGLIERTMELSHIFLAVQVLSNFRFIQIIGFTYGRIRRL